MDSKLIDKFYKGECTPEEVKKVLRWFKNTEPGMEQEQDLLEFWNEADQQNAEMEYVHDSKQTWARIKNIVESHNTAEEHSSIGEETNTYSIAEWIMEHQYKVAAAILLPLCFLGAFLYYFSGIDKSTAQLATVEALPGFKKTITLEDGSVITLNSGSKVTYPVHFPKDKREILLQGEAFFEVAKDSLRPFTVQSGTILTQALGTSFNIKYRPEDKTIAVALATGTVKIERQEQKKQTFLATLTPGKQLVYDKPAQQHQVENYDSRELLAWKEGALYFKNANLDQVIRQLEYWYGVDIEIAGKAPAEAKEWNYTGEYNRETLDAVLEGLSFVKDFSYQRTGKKVKIRFNNS